jgi:hypothetical protein
MKCSDMILVHFYAGVGFPEPARSLTGGDHLAPLMTQNSGDWMKMKMDALGRTGLLVRQGGSSGRWTKDHIPDTDTSDDEEVGWVIMKS